MPFCLPKYLIRHAQNHPFSHSALTSSPRLRAASTRPASSHPLTHPATSFCRAMTPSVITLAAFLASLSPIASPGLGNTPARSCRHCRHCLSSRALSVAAPAMAALAPSNISTTPSSPGLALRPPLACPCLPPPCPSVTTFPTVTSLLICAISPRALLLPESAVSTALHLPPTTCLVSANTGPVCSPPRLHTLPTPSPLASPPPDAASSRLQPHPRLMLQHAGQPCASRLHACPHSPLSLSLFTSSSCHLPCVT